MTTAIGPLDGSVTPNGIRACGGLSDYLYEITLRDPDADTLAEVVAQAARVANARSRVRLLSCAPLTQAHVDAITSNDDGRTTIVGELNDTRGDGRGPYSKVYIAWYTLGEERVKHVRVGSDRAKKYITAVFPHTLESSIHGFNTKFVSTKITYVYPNIGDLLCHMTRLRCDYGDKTLDSFQLALMDDPADVLTWSAVYDYCVDIPSYEAYAETAKAAIAIVRSLNTGDEIERYPTLVHYISDRKDYSDATPVYGYANGGFNWTRYKAHMPHRLFSYLDGHLGICTITTDIENTGDRRRMSYKYYPTELAAILALCRVVALVNSTTNSFDQE